jgi:hypothetical protein
MLSTAHRCKYFLLVIQITDITEWKFYHARDEYPPIASLAYQSVLGKPVAA